MEESKVFDFIEREKQRQEHNIELIASENFVSENIRKAMGSILTNKYCEGYPALERSGSSGRYYGGCQIIDEMEQYCCDMWKKVFNTDYHVNVQPHSGSQANQCAYAAVAKPGDTILAMSLENGGHLTHGSPVNFSGKLYNFVFYDVDEFGFIDYNDLREKIYKYNPSVVVAGASAYPRGINFEKIKNIINEAIFDDHDKSITFMVDMAHVAGLVAAGYHNSPFGYADIITTTTHKTLRGPRGGMIFCKPELAKRVDSAVFPGNQGGPLEHVIAAKAICAEEALDPSFKDYIKQVILNANAMANEFKRLGYDVITGGTENHLLLLDFSRTNPNLTGKELQNKLDEIGITLNKNMVPGDKRKPSETSGVRIGTAPMTTKGYKEDDFIAVARIIDKVVKSLER